MTGRSYLKEPFPVDLFVEDGDLKFECPVCDKRLWPRPVVKFIHSPAKCPECRRKFVIRASVKVVE